MLKRPKGTDEEREAAQRNEAKTISNKERDELRAQAKTGDKAAQSLVEWEDKVEWDRSVQTGEPVSKENTYLKAVASKVREDFEFNTKATSDVKNKENKTNAGLLTRIKNNFIPRSNKIISGNDTDSESSHSTPTSTPRSKPTAKISPEFFAESSAQVGNVPPSSGGRKVVQSGVSK